MLVRLLAMVAATPLACCTTNVFQTFDIDRGKSLSIDARQRMVLVVRDGGRTRDRTVACAEPSPDEVVAQAAWGSASGEATLLSMTEGATEQSSISGSVASTSSEAQTAIAMRSRTVQLLRDNMFRICEAYMKGAIDQHQYNVALFNIDKQIITALGLDAIRAITPDAPPGVASGGTGAKAVQSEALANVVLAADAHSSQLGSCIGMMASGALRPDDPGEHAVLARCDRLLTTAVTDLVKQAQDPIRSHVPRPGVATANPRPTITHTRPKDVARRPTQINRARMEQTAENSANSSFQSRWLDISTRLSPSKKIAAR
jgi:hypothetical protein